MFNDVTHGNHDLFNRITNMDQMPCSMQFLSCIIRCNYIK